MATFNYPGYDDDQITWPGGSPTNGDTITFTQPTDHVISITDNDTQLQDGTDDRDDEDSTQTAIVYDEFGNVETSGQVQPRDEITLTDGTNTYFMTEVFIAATNSYYYIFQDPPPVLGVEYTVTNVSNPNSTNYSELSTTGIACFTTGTLIRTPDGKRPVETLRPGDLINTLDRGAMRLLWVGTRRASYGELINDKGLRPILVPADAFGNGRPSVDTLYSRQHRILLEKPLFRHRLVGDRGALAPVHALTSLDGVRETCPPAGVGYVHLMTSDHNLLWSNGLVTKTLLLTAYSASMSQETMSGPIKVPANLLASPMKAARPILKSKLARRLADRIGRSRNSRDMKAGDFATAANGTLIRDYPYL